MKHGKNYERLYPFVKINSNMRCIETSRAGLLLRVPGPINSNMRCIETGGRTAASQLHHAINSNMRCIETITDSNSRKAEKRLIVT